jgi:hypothetical protein
MLATEVVDLAVSLGLAGGRSIDLHAANGINRHDAFPFRDGHSNEFTVSRATS